VNYRTSDATAGAGSPQTGIRCATHSGVALWKSLMQQLGLLRSEEESGPECHPFGGHGEGISGEAAKAGVLRRGARPARCSGVVLRESLMQQLGLLRSEP